MAYAYICSECHHPASRHTLRKGGETVPGPYDCAFCDCSIRQDSPMYELNQREYGARFGVGGRPLAAVTR